jgi:cell division protein FtsB
MFDRQMAQSASATASDQAEGAPRAAIYETKMGATHRRSARLQNAAQAGPVSAKINPAGWFSNFHVRPRVAGIVTAVVCVLLIGVFLYAPARDYYQAQRQHDRLSTEYTQIEQRNAALTEQNQTLASDAGMEDAVRQKYGYVVQGDQTAVVTGLSDVTTDSARDSENIEANVLASAVKAPEEWYTPYLDAFFGVS